MLQSKYESYVNCIKAEEKLTKTGIDYKYQTHLNKKLNRLNSYQRFKDEIESDYQFDQFKSNSEMEIENTFRSNFGAKKPTSRVMKYYFY